MLSARHAIDASRDSVRICTYCSEPIHTRSMPTSALKSQLLICRRRYCLSRAGFCSLPNMYIEERAIACCRTSRSRRPPSHTRFNSPRCVRSGGCSCYGARALRRPRSQHISGARTFRHQQVNRLPSTRDHGRRGGLRIEWPIFGVSGESEAHDCTSQGKYRFWIDGNIVALPSQLWIQIDGCCANDKDTDTGTECGCTRRT